MPAPAVGQGDDEVVLDGVSKRFGSTLAVDRVSISIRRGEFFSLLGPSGCGKSTTLRIVSGFERPTEGTVLIRGRVMNDVSPHRRNTNLVFQQLALFPHLDVFDNIAFGPRIKRVPRASIAERVRAMLELVGLGGFERRRVSQLSGGQQQRVAIARALVNEPAVLLLDEPLGALDLKLREQMQRELKAIQHRVGTTFVYVTHDQGEALTMSDRMAVMNAGRVEQIGTGPDLYLSPATTFVAGFIGETNLLRGRVVGSNGASAVVEVHGQRVRVATGATGEPPGEGADVTLSARPERLGIAAAGDGGDGGGGWPGRVADVSFLGNTIRYEVALPWDERLKIDTLAGREPMLPEGREVRVVWDAGAAVLVGEDR